MGWAAIMVVGGCLLGPGSETGWGIGGMGYELHGGPPRAGSRPAAGVADTWVQVAGGGNHWLTLSADGTVEAWGGPNHGKTQVPEAVRDVVMVAAGGEHSLALTRNGSVIGWGGNWYGQTEAPPSATNVVAIGAGWAHSVALRADGTLVAWGNNEYGQLPIPGSALSVVAMEVGAFHTVALRADGQVIGWGYEAAAPVSLTRAVAIAAGWNHSAALTPEGTVVVWGDTRHFQAAGMPKIEGGRKVFAGYNLTAVWDAEGFMHVWGDDTFGKRTTLAQTSKVALVGIADDFSIVVPDIGEPILGRLPSQVQVAHGGHLLIQPQVRASGTTRFQWHRDGQPIEGATESSLMVESVKAEEGGGYHLVAEVEGRLWESEVVQVTVEEVPRSVVGVQGWGDSNHGQTLPPSGLWFPQQIAAGHFHGLLLEVDGSVLGWGNNRFGQATAPSGLIPARVLAAGGYHSLALLTNGLVVAWGANWDEQCDVPESEIPVVEIAAGWAHSLAIRADGSVVAWGNNDYGQCSVPPLPGRAIRVAAGYFHSLVLLSDGRVVGWGEHDSPPKDLDRVVALAAGFQHSLALRDDGKILAWGEDDWGETQVPDDLAPSVAIAAGFGFSVALSADGKCRVWGRNAHGVANVPTALRHVGAVCSGEDFVLALSEQGPPRFANLPHQGPFTSGSPWSLPLEVRGSRPLTTLVVRGMGDGIEEGSGGGFLLNPLVEDSVMHLKLSARNHLGEADQETDVRVLQERPTAVLVPGHQVRMEGGTAAIRAVVSGSPPLHWEWERNGEPVDGGDGDSLFMDPVMVTDAGHYTVSVRNPYGTQRSGSSVLEIREAPRPEEFDRIEQSGILEAFNEGAQPWWPQSTPGSELLALRSHHLLEGEQAILTLRVQGPGVLRWTWGLNAWHRMDSLVFESGDQLPYHALFGATLPHSMEVPVPEGTATVSWIHTSYSGFGEQTDEAHLQDVRFVPNWMIQFGIHPSGDGMFLLLQGPVGGQYSILTSESLISGEWSVLTWGEFTGSIQVVEDSILREAEGRFYQLRLE